MTDDMKPDPVHEELDDEALADVAGGMFAKVIITPIARRDGEGPRIKHVDPE